MEKLIFLPVTELILPHREVTGVGVAKYVDDILGGKPLDPGHGSFCVHDDCYYVDDGTHRAVAVQIAESFTGRNLYRLLYEPCYMNGCNGDDRDIQKPSVRQVVFESTQID